MKEGVTAEEITGIMQNRCRDKKKAGGATGLMNKISKIFHRIQHILFFFSRKEIE